MDSALKNPAFWANHYYLLMADFEECDSVLLNRFFGLTEQVLEAFYRSVVDKGPLGMALGAGLGLALEYADCGEDGTEARFHITGEQPPFDEVLGYESPSFALPAFRWEEIRQICASQADPARAATAGLLCFRAAKLSNDKEAADATHHLLRWWDDMPWVRVYHAEQLVHNIVANSLWKNFAWRQDSELGWINDGDYSFRNPGTLMCPFSAERFENVRRFFSALNLTGPEQA